jgi:hypothetical protein
MKQGRASMEVPFNFINIEQDNTQSNLQINFQQNNNTQESLDAG